MADHGSSGVHGKGVLSFGVTRAEMEDYVGSQIHAAKGESEALRSAYDELYDKYEALLTSRGLAPAESTISDTAIDLFVKKLLADPDVNIRWVPDAVEGPIYRNLVKMILHSIAQTGATAHIELFGHRIRFHVEPAPVEGPPAAASDTQK
jgi:hypothetical protein